jgi:hypothetical protein
LVAVNGATDRAEPSALTFRSVLVAQCGSGKRSSSESERRRAYVDTSRGTLPHSRPPNRTLD